VQRTQIQK
jgi:hypothetical protein